MLVFEIPKENSDLIKKVSSSFPNSEVVDVNSLDAETITQVIIPIIQTTLPVVSAIIVAALGTSKKVKVKWNNLEISGTEKQVEKFLEKIVDLEIKIDKNKKKQKARLKCHIKTI